MTSYLCYHGFFVSMLVLCTQVKMMLVVLFLARCGHIVTPQTFILYIKLFVNYFILE